MRKGERSRSAGTRSATVPAQGGAHAGDGGTVSGAPPGPAPGQPPGAPARAWVRGTGLAQAGSSQRASRCCRPQMELQALKDQLEVERQMWEANRAKKEVGRGRPAVPLPSRQHPSLTAWAPPLEPPTTRSGFAAGCSGLAVQSELYCPSLSALGDARGAAAGPRWPQRGLHLALPPGELLSKLTTLRPCAGHTRGRPPSHLLVSPDGWAAPPGSAVLLERGSWGPHGRQCPVPASPLAW